MSIDKLVDSNQLDADLTSVANAIRTKGGTSGQLAFPNGFVSAVQNIPTGTTPTGTKQISITQNGTATENVADYANAEITTNVPQMQRSVLRPDAELVETWSYDKLWIAEEGETLPAYSTTAQTLKASEELEVTHEWDLDNYKYFVLIRGLVIPIYNTDRIARGRVEWSSSNAAYELLYSPAETFRALVDSTKSYDSTVIGWNPAGYMCYRMPYFTNSAGIVSVYSGTGFGVWINMMQPTYTGGVLHINSPSFTLRCQANILDQPFYEAFDDIRFQWVIELWREPVGSLTYNGWIANQELDRILECVYSTNHKLT